jgi:hypothetical protein
VTAERWQQVAGVYQRALEHALVLELVEGETLDARLKARATDEPTL